MLGALLGLATSALFFDVDAREIRSSAETCASAVPGPIADLIIANLDRHDVFGRVADDVPVSAEALVPPGIGEV